VHRLFASVVAPLIEAAKPAVIAEVGAGAGRLTRRVLEAPGAAEAVVHAIDPAPTLDPELTRAEANRLVVHRERAATALGAVGRVDLVLLDGDPNWHAVHSELKALARSARQAEREAPLVVVHNVHWPFGRRDGYYEPEAIPSPLRHEYTDLGLVPGHRDPSATGLRLAPWCAVGEFEPRSGVLTAVEDFVAASDLRWEIVEVPGFHGVAVLAEARLLEGNPALAAALEALRSPLLLGRQARQAELARLAAELELAAARREHSQGAAPDSSPEAEVSSPVEESAVDEPEPEPSDTVQGRGDLVVEAAQERVRREGLEWQLERLEVDLAERDGRLEALRAERDAERQALAEARVHAEAASGSLATEREANALLRQRAGELERVVAQRGAKIEETGDRARLAEGRLAHSQDLAEALRGERDRLRVEAEGLRRDLDSARASMGDVADHLDRVAGSRRARVGRWLARLSPIRRTPTPVEEARSLARGALSATASADFTEVDDPRVEAETR
jgi:hypothetical protein